jgi:hypothetical protein
MTYVIPPGFTRLSFTYAPVSPLGSAITWGIGLDANPSPTLLDVAQAWYEDEQQALVSEGYVLNRIEARNDTLVYERLLSLDGEDTSATPPPQVAALISLSTGLPGRSNRGRVYWPGVLEESAVNAQGQIDPLVRTTIQNQWENFLAALETIDATPVILHSSSSDPTPVLSSVVRGNVATQRRRQRA